MKLADPLSVKAKEPKYAIVFSADQSFGGRVKQEDYFAHFTDECFVVADGVSGIPHGEVASKLAAETAVWGYKHVRQRKFYWADKKLFLKRIFRSSNLSVWQKQREYGYEQGLLTTLVVAIIGAQNVWIGSVGDTGAFLYHNGEVRKLTRDEVDEKGGLTNVVGDKRLGLVPQIAVKKLYPNDCVVLATDGVTRYISEKDLVRVCEGAGNTTESVKKSVQRLLHIAQKNNSTDNMTVCMIKKIEKT